MRKINTKTIIADLYNFVDLFTKIYMSEKNVQPKMEIIMVGDDPGSKSYVSLKKKRATEHNIECKIHKINKLDENRVEKIKNIISKCSKNKIPCMCQLPMENIPEQDKIDILNMINLFIDVDGLNPYTLGMNFVINCESENFKLNVDRLKPCTAAGIRMILKKYKVNLRNQNVLVIGRSKLLGKPIADLLIAEDANVTVVHSKTSKDKLNNYAKQSDIIISTAGVANLVTPDMVKRDSILIDTGYSKINGQVIGDIERGCWEKSYLYNEYTDCIGPLTVALLIFNTCLFTYSNSDISDILLDKELIRLKNRYELG